MVIHILQILAFIALIPVVSTFLVTPFVKPFCLSKTSDAAVMVAASGNQLLGRTSCLTKSHALIRKSVRTSSRFVLLATKMSKAESSVSQLEQIFETAIIAAVPAASEQDLEELLAILTTTARSLERRLAQGREDVSNARARLTSNLRQKLLDEEALLNEEQWNQITSMVDLLDQRENAVQSPFDPQASFREMERQLQDAMTSYVASTRGLSADDEAELRAIVTTVCRSFSRKISQGKEAAQSRQELWDKVHAALEQRVVGEEGLLDSTAFAALMAHCTQAAPAASPPSAVATAPKLQAPATKAPASTAPASTAPATGTSKGELLRELRRLFPAHDAALLEAAAAKASDLEGAVFEVLSIESPWGTSQGDDAAPLAGGASRTPPGAGGSSATQGLSAPAGAGETRSLTTKPVTTGACSFGLCFDVAAKERGVTVTGLRSAASPGLNWGQGQPLRVAVYATRDLGSSRGRELEAGAWECVGREDGLTLPLVSWADQAPVYGALPLAAPVYIPPGASRGFLVHTNDLYGLVTAVGAGAGGSDEVLGNHDDDPTGGVLRPGSVVCEDEGLELRAGYTIGAALFEEFDGVAMPSAGAFVGVIDYTLH